MELGFALFLFIVVFSTGEATPASSENASV
jgi:hypothetical protein